MLDCFNNSVLRIIYAAAKNRDKFIRQFIESTSSLSYYYSGIARNYFVSLIIF